MADTGGSEYTRSLSPEISATSVAVPARSFSEAEEREGRENNNKYFKEKGGEGLAVVLVRFAILFINIAIISVIENGSYFSWAGYMVAFLASKSACESRLVLAVGYNGNHENVGWASLAPAQPNINMLRISF